MDGSRQTDGPGERRPGQQLARPPSDRFRTTDEAPATEGDRPPLARRVGAAVVAGVIGALVIAVAGGLLTMTAGLLVIAAVVGWIVALALTSGAGRGSDRSRRRWTAATITLAGVALGQIGLWLIARGEGGTLGPIDYLAEVFGVLVPAQLLIGAIVAWWRAA